MEKDLGNRGARETSGESFGKPDKKIKMYVDTKWKSAQVQVLEKD